MTEESWLREVTQALREPVAASSDFDRRVLAALAADRRRRRALAWTAPFGLAASLVLALLGWRFLADRPVANPFVKVAFAIDAPSAGSVSVVGDFNDWDKAGTPLTKDAGTGRWRAVVSLKNGIYHYAFLVDGVRWVGDSTQPGPVDDFGEATSVLAVE